jgi:hypothetical protein
MFDCFHCSYFRVKIRTATFVHISLSVQPSAANHFDRRANSSETMYLLPHKTVNLIFLSVIVNDNLTILWGSGLPKLNSCIHSVRLKASLRHKGVIVWHIPPGNHVLSAGVWHHTVDYGPFIKRLASRNLVQGLTGSRFGHVPSRIMGERNFCSPPSGQHCQETCPVR